MSIIQTYVAPKSGDKKKKRKVNGPKISHIDPSLLPTAVVEGTRMLMNLAPIDPADNPFAAVALKRNARTGYVTTPRNKTVSRLGERILYSIVVCSYCWKQGDLLLGPDGEGWTLDHVIPHCKGGIENLSNLVKSCWSCNKLKGQHHTWVPHPQSAWAAADPEVGMELWHEASAIYDGTLTAQPYTVEIATQEEMDALTAQWLLTQPV